MIELVHDAVIAFNLFVVAYLFAQNLNQLVLISYFGVAVAVGIAFSFGALLVEERAFQRYRRWRCFGRLVLAAGIENFGYRQWYALIRVRACWSHLRRHRHPWEDTVRSGFSPASAPSKS